MKSQTSGNYQFDGNGNLIADRSKGIVATVYDWRNLPTETVLSNGDRVRYRYNADGKRIYKFSQQTIRKPVITSALSATGWREFGFTYKITADNEPTSFGATGLPSGLTIDPVRGTISGAPAAVGTYNVQLQATNRAGSDTKTLVITVREPFTVTLAINGSGRVVNPYSGGSNYAAGVYRFAGGSLFALRAEGINGGSFTGWSGLLTGNPNEPTQIITVTQNLNLTANFTGAVLPTYTVSVSKSPSNGGIVSDEFGPIEQRTVASGGGITLNANTNSGFVFQDWLLNGTARSGNPLTLSNITANQSVVARWQANTLPQVGIGLVSATTNSLSFNTATQNAPSGAFLKWEFFDGQSWLGYNNVQPNTLSGINIVQGLGPNTTYRLRAVLRDESDNQTLAVSETVQGTTSASTIAPPVITAPDISTTIYSPVSNYVIGLQNADSYSVTGLPPWLSQSGVFLSGEPTVAHLGNSSFTITATNAGGTTTKTVAVQVLWPALNADLVLTQGDYVSQVAYASSTLQAGELILQPKYGSLPNGLSLTVRRQNPITIEGGTVGDIELVGTPTQTGIFYAEYEMTVTYYEPFRQDVLPLRLRIEVVPSGGGSGFSTMSAMSVMEGTSGGEMSAMSNGSSGGSFIPDTLRLNAYQPNATARKVVQLLPGFSTVDANGQSRPFGTSVVGGSNPVPSGESVVITTRSDYELGASGNLLATYDDGALQASRYETGYGYITASGARFYYHRDHLGNVRAVSDRFGNKVRWTDYFAYGAIRDEWSIGQTRDNYGYTGKELNRETGLNDFGARHFDALVGIWTRVEPLWSKFPQYSPYIYGINNPLRVIDYDGRDIIVLNASKGAGGFGHAAVLIGNDKDGWQLYSKNGTAFPFGMSGPSTNPDVAVKFNTLEEFANQNFTEKSGEILYDGGFLIPSDQDEVMKNAIGFITTSWYDVSGITAMLGLGNCADVVTEALAAGKIENGITPVKAEYMGFSLSVANPTPNIQYQTIKQRNAGIGKDVTNRLMPSQKRQEEAKKEAEQKRKEQFRKMIQDAIKEWEEEIEKENKN